jgi:hypothetical protein
MPSTLAQQTAPCTCTHAFLNHFGPLKTSARPPKAGRCKQCSGCSAYTPGGDSAGRQGLRELVATVTRTTTMQDPAATVTLSLPPTGKRSLDDEVMEALGLRDGLAAGILRAAQERDGITTDQLVEKLQCSAAGLSHAIHRLMEHDLIFPCGQILVAEDADKVAYRLGCPLHGRACKKQDECACPQTASGVHKPGCPRLGGYR